MRLFAFLVFFTLFGAAHAEEQNKLSCNELDLFECETLANNYLVGKPPFPKDLKLAEKFQALAVKGAIAGCSGQDYTLCYSYKKFKLENWMHRRQTPAISLQEFFDHVENYKQITESGCANGSSYACYWRSILFPNYRHRSFIADIAKLYGEDFSQFQNSVKEDQEQYQNLAYETALRESKPLRTKCENGDLFSCGDLGGLIHDRKIPIKRPFEQVDLLIDGCMASNVKACFSVRSAINQLAISKPSKETEGPVKNAALKRVEGFCESGEKDACYILSKTYKSNEYPDKDADAFVEKSCQFGHGGACYFRAVRTYFKFQKSQQDEDLAKAKTYYQKACDESHAVACHALKHL